MDVGANIGSLAIPIAKARPNVSIVCIEADPNIHRLLKENVDRNGCSRIQVVSCVVGAIDGQIVAFYRAPEDQFGMGSLGPQFNVEPIRLEQRSLDAVLDGRDIQQVDVIKIDVEGGELGVLRGSLRLLAAKRPPSIVFEFSDWAEARIFDQQPGDAQSFLLANDYRIFCLERHRKIGEEVMAPLRHGSAMLVAVSRRALAHQAVIEKLRMNWFRAC